MDNLGNLFQVAPTTAGFMLGGQIADTRAMNEAKRQETLQDVLMKQQQYGFNEQNNPLLLDKQRTLNQGYGLDNEKQSLANETTRKTQQSTIDATNTKNATEALANHLKQAEQTEKFFTNAADQLANMPPPMRSQWLTAQMQQAGLDASNPAMQQYIQQASQNPVLLKQHAAAIAQERTQRMPEYIKALAEEREKGRNQIANTREHNKGAKEVAEIQAQGRVQAATVRAGRTAQDIQSQVLSGKLKLSEMPAAFEFAARQAQDPEERAFLMEQARKANQLLLDKPNAKPVSEVDNGKISSTKPSPAYGAPIDPKDVIDLDK